MKNLFINGFGDISEFPMDFLLSNPYQQFSFNIADGASEVIFYNHNFVRFLELSATSGVTIKFGGSGGLGSDVVGSGIGYGLPAGKVTDRIEIVNNSGGALTGTVALALGFISDDRLTVSGLIRTADKPANIVSIADTALSTSASNVMPANTNRAEAFITNLDSSIDIRFGDSNITTTRGAVIPAGGSAVIRTTDDLYLVAESGTPSVALSYTEYN